MKLAKSIIKLVQNIITPEEPFDIPDTSYLDLKSNLDKQKTDANILYLWMRFKERSLEDNASLDFGATFIADLKSFSKKIRKSGFDESYCEYLVAEVNSYKAILISRKEITGSFNANKEETTLSNSEQADGLSITSRNLEDIEKENKATATPKRKNKPPVAHDDYVFDLSQYNTSNKASNFKEVEKKNGISPYKPIGINNSFSSGFMYYPVEIVVGHHEEHEDNKDDNKILEHLKTIVVRSDRTIKQAIESEAPSHANKSSRVFRLDDGTLIDSEPKPNNHGTWEWRSIERYLGGEIANQSLLSILHDMRSYIKNKVWIPNEDDYWLLALIAMASYSQSIYNAVPMVLLQGPAGTGKSELGSAMRDISANGVMIGQVSAAAMARLIEESSGLVVIDDLESIGAKSKGQQVFSDIAQTLKVSQKKSTAVKAVTDPKTQTTRMVNFYGIKIISNTRGSDDILGSRLLKIRTQKMPQEIQERFIKREKYDDESLPDLRNNCHCWTFENVENIHKLYNNLYDLKTNREEEISIPVHVIAKLSGDQEIEAAAIRALANQKQLKSIPTDSTEIINRAVTSLIIKGHKEAFLTHIALEVKRILNPSISPGNIDTQPWVTPEGIGKKIRALNLHDPKDKGTRKRLHEKNLRVIHLNKKMIEDVRIKNNINIPTIDPKKFCFECEECIYTNLECPIKSERLKKQTPVKV